MYELNFGIKIFVLFTMLFLHIVDDFYLQGVLAKLKQRSWWKENAPDELYRNDYKIALFEHSFSWTFVVMIPIMVIMVYTGKIDWVWYIIAFIAHMIIHATIDDFKANKRYIGLAVDQIFHLFQVCLIWLLFFV